MSPILTLLSTSAIPFQYPTDYPPQQQQQHITLAERRQRRGTPSINVPHILDLENNGGEDYSASRQDQLNVANQRALMAAVLNVAVKTIHYAIGQEDVQSADQDIEPTNMTTASSQSNSNVTPRGLEVEEVPRAPPNSPSYEESQRSFEFPDAECTVVPTQQRQLDSQDCAHSVNRLRRTRSMRKRRRKSSFKDPSTQPRVAPKFPQFEHISTSSNEADDEGSDDEVVLNNRRRTIPRTPAKHCHKIFSYHHKLNDKGLQFGLELVAETQKLSSSSSSEGVVENKKHAKMTDWSKVGEELRNIADSFQVSSTKNGEGTNLRVEATLTGVVPLDILSVINMMLPISIPQSLWSALVSYAAWKIFKRFQ